MGDHDQRALAADQVPGEPVDTADVEVVGGLVEDQQVRLAHQQRGQRHPAALAAGHRPDRLVQAEVRHAEAVEDGAHAGVAGPLVLGAHALVEPGGAEHDVAHGRVGGRA